MHWITINPMHCSNTKQATIPSLHFQFRYKNQISANSRIKVSKILPTSKCHFHFWPDSPSDMKNVPYEANKPPFIRFTSVFIFSLNLYQLLNQFSSLSRIVKITFASYQEMGTKSTQLWLLKFNSDNYRDFSDPYPGHASNKDSQ